MKRRVVVLRLRRSGSAPDPEASEGVDAGCAVAAAVGATGSSVGDGELGCSLASINHLLKLTRHAFWVCGIRNRGLFGDHTAVVNLSIPASVFVNPKCRSFWLFTLERITHDANLRRSGWVSLS